MQNNVSKNGTHVTFVQLGCICVCTCDNNLAWKLEGKGVSGYMFVPHGFHQRSFLMHAICIGQRSPFEVEKGVTTLLLSYSNGKELGNSTLKVFKRNGAWETQLLRHLLTR